METIRLITHAEQGMIIEVPFDVPEHTESIKVAYRVKPLGEGKCTIDLGVADTSGLRGWSGGARKEAFIALERATPGYKAGPLPAGRWEVLLGAYEVPPTGCEVILTFQISSKQQRWIPGDLHTHSVHSDGKLSVAELADRAQARGLQFIALTDHNTSTQNCCITPYNPVVLIPGYEWSSYTGHANIYGLEEPLSDFRCANSHSVAELLRCARSKGARISLNHILDDAYASGVWRWGYNVEYDWVEIWNGPWRPSNQAALTWWDAQLRKGMHLPAVGGSDFHRPHNIVDLGRPTTWVYCDSATVDSILCGINAGRAVISCDPAGPFMEAWCNQTTFGDSIKAVELIEKGLTMTVQRGAGDKLVLLSATGPLFETEIPTDSWCLNWRMPNAYAAQELRYIRLELWHYCTEVNQALPSALSNPIYIM